MLRYRALSVPFALLGVGCMPIDADRSTRIDEAFLAIAEAEDARPTSGPGLERLDLATRSDSRFLRAAAVRALGRLESPARAPAIVALLDDAAPEVRAMAANALAQAYFGTDGSPAVPALRSRAEAEHHPGARGSVAASIGRLRLAPDQADDVADLLVDMSYAHGVDAPADVMVGVALGLEALGRSTGGAIVRGRVERRLDELRLYQDGTRTRESQARIRALVLNTLGAAGRITMEQLRIALRDESPVVRAAGARWIASLPAEWRSEGLRNVMFSRSFHAAVEGLRFIQSAPRTATTCGYLLEGAAVPRSGAAADPALRTLSIDGLATACPDRERQRAVLRSAAAPDQIDDVFWQPAAHALVALAGLFPSDAQSLLRPYVTHSNPFVRTYGATAAGVVGDRDVLGSLLDDPAPNVRTATLRALVALDGSAAHEVAIGQLGVRDPQLIMTAAAALEGSTDPAAGRALTDALDLMSEERRETFRDARRAVLARLADMARPELTDRLIPYLSDYDPLVAEDAATVLQAWNGRPYFATPLLPARADLPTVAELRLMAAATVVVHMAGVGEIHVALHPYSAPTNAWRFFRQASDGYFDGLTFHRWAPNFVLQGGSPNANEYYGGAAFTRDEVGPNHWRGTVGISTRGHDTGDGQIFINLLDNPRLDHQYTIIGTVVEGIDVVDRVLEGGVIERVEVRTGG